MTPKIVLVLEYDHGEIKPWRLTAYKKWLLFGRDYVKSWWFETEAEALAMIEVYREKPLLREFVV